MKILYFGTVCHIHHYEALLKKCKKKPTVATVVFESALLEGFHQNDAELKVYSFPMIPTFPQSSLLRFGGKEEMLPSGYSCHWLNTVNVPFLKQWTRCMDARRVIKRWIKKNASDGVILTYSIPPFLAKEVVDLGKKHGVRTVAIVPDLPQNMYLNHKKNPMVDAIKSAYLGLSLRYQGKYDGYVYLSEAMREIVAPQKPYVVMEGILDMDAWAHQSANIPKSCPRAIMYAGRLHEKYGIMSLLDAFDRLRDLDAELWLFGEGTAVDEIRNRARLNDRIKYFGRVNRDEILEYERKATLLVNPRSVKDEFTKYSFPSKTIEYMYSGTPVLTTKLGGIPNEYYEYVFAADDNDPLSLERSIREALAMSENDLINKGMKARAFVKEQKNAVVQSKRVIDFLSEILGTSHEIGK